ncbi:hypothetical protein L9F63_024703, partial [Diploptera punctata]
NFTTLEKWMPLKTAVLAAEGIRRAVLDQIIFVRGDDGTEPSAESTPGSQTRTLELLA